MAGARLALARTRRKNFEPVSSVLSRGCLKRCMIATRCIADCGRDGRRGAARAKCRIHSTGVDAQVADAAAEWLEDSGAIEAVRELWRCLAAMAAPVLREHGRRPVAAFRRRVDRVEFEVISRYDLRVVERYADPERSDYGAPAVFEAYTFASGVDSGMRVRPFTKSRQCASAASSVCVATSIAHRRE